MRVKRCRVDEMELEGWDCIESMEGHSAETAPTALG